MSDEKEILLSPMKEINGLWYNTELELERKCYERGGHRFGPDKFADEDCCTQGYHKCLDCFRYEFL